MLGLILAAVLSASGANCAAPRPQETLIDQIPLDSGSGRLLQAATFRRASSEPSDIPATRIEIYSPRCEPLFEQLFEFTTEVRLIRTKLGDRSVLVATALSPGGSGCGLAHVILDYSEAMDPIVISPAILTHTNMGGIFVGDLGEARGPGLVLWDAVWDSGAHYDPHPYRVVTYRWVGKGFVGPVVVETKPMNPDPEKVAKILRIPYSSAMSFPC